MRRKAFFDGYQKTGSLLGLPATYSGLADELLPASGAGDGDFPLPTGDTDGLAALGAIEIAVVAVLQAVENQQKLPVFLVALVGIPGKRPEDGPNHQRIAQDQEEHPHTQVPEQRGENAGYQTCAQNDHIQPVGSIPPGHKAAKTCAHARACLMQPKGKFVHKYPPFPQGKIKSIPILYCVFWEFQHRRRRINGLFKNVKL